MRNLLSKYKKQISIVIVLILVASLWVPSGMAAGRRAKFPVQKIEQDVTEESDDFLAESMEESVEESNSSSESSTESETEPPPAVGSLSASSTVRTSISSASLSELTIPAKAGDLVSVWFTITNTGNTPLTDPAIYTMIPTGVSLQSVNGNGGAIRYFNGTPPLLANIGTLGSAGSTNPTGATAVYVGFAQPLQPNSSVAMEAVFQINQGTSLTSHNFSYTAKDSSGNLLAAATATSKPYSTDVFYIEYIKPMTYQTITGIPVVRAGVFDASGVKNIAISSVQPTTAGQTFSHWNTQANGLGTSYDSGATITLTRGGTNGISLYPTWRANSFVVGFNPDNGAAIPSVTYAEGTVITEPAVTRAGYTLDGWYTDVNTKWNFSTDLMPSQAMTLTARWTAVPIPQYRVDFLPEGGIVTPMFRDVPGGALISPPMATRTGYRLKHWVTPTNAVWDFSTQPMGSGNVTLTAVWEQNQSDVHTVTFDGSGGLVTPKTANYKFGSKLVEPTITREYYIFDGWKTAAGATWNFVVNTMPDNDLTLKAQWKFDVVGARLPVTFETGAGSMIPAVQRLQLGSKIAKPMDPRKVAYTFAGWRRQGDTKNWDFNTLIREEDFAKPFLLVAQWQDNNTREVLVSFRTQDGSPTPASQRIMPGGFVESPSGVYREGYSLVGWYTGPNRGYTKWDFETSQVPAENATLVLYASWSNDDRSGRSRPDTSPNTPRRYGVDKAEVITGTGWGGGPTEVLENNTSQPAPSDKKPSVTVGQQKPAWTGKPSGEINPNTGGLKHVEPKQSVPAVVVKQVKEKTNQIIEKTEQIKKEFSDMTANADASELSMLWIGLFMGIAAFLLFILGIIKRGRKR